MHNALQGAERTLTDRKKEAYLTYCTRNAHLLEQEYEPIVAHDAQPVASPQFHGRGHTKTGDGTLPYRGGHPGRCGRARLGSVSSKVLQAASGPVLVYPREAV